MLSFDMQVAQWARSKPADEAYDYVDNRNCAVCQFLISNGYTSNPSVGIGKWRDLNNQPLVSHAFSETLQAAASKRPYTFGALAERLSA